MYVKYYMTQYDMNHLETEFEQGTDALHLHDVEVGARELLAHSSLILHRSQRFHV